MDHEEFKRIAYPELAELLAGRLSATPEPQPLDISPWIAQSLLQKSIRRGEAGLALRASASLLRDDPDKLWRRLSVIAYEDIGLGSLDLIMPTLIATSGKVVRRAFHGEWPVASAIVEGMATARKDRSADNAYMVAAIHFQYSGDRLSLTFRPIPELMRIATGDGDIITRSIATIYAVGTDRCRTPGMRVRKGDPRYVFHAMREAGFPFTVVDLSERGSTQFREPLPALMSLMSSVVPGHSTGWRPTERDDDIPPTTMIGEVPGWSLDWYTRPGRATIRAFLRHDTPTSRWLKANVAPRDRAEALGGLVFRVEGGLLRRRLQWEAGSYLRRTMETEAVGFGITDASDVLDLLRNDLPLLNEERRHVL